MNTPRLSMKRYFSVQFSAALLGLAVFCSSSVFAIANSEGVNNFEQVEFAQNRSWTLADTVTVDQDKTGFIVQADKHSQDVLINQPINGDVENSHLQTVNSYHDVSVYFEFYITSSTNAGVFLADRYRISINDIYGKKSWWSGSMGGIFPRRDDDREWKNYDGVKAIANASKPVGEWQSLAIKFRAPRFDKNGVKLEYAQFIEVLVNGNTVLENAVATGPSAWAPEKHDAAHGPISFIGTGGPIAIRNLKILPADFSDVKPAKPVADIDKAPLDKEQGKPMLNLVEVGKQIFLNKGCKECHSVDEQSDAVKTGPSLWATFSPKPKAQPVFDGQEDLHTTMLADTEYFEKAIRQPNLHIAKRIQSDGSLKQFLPIMPAFSEEILKQSDLDALYTYLLSLNPDDSEFGKGSSYVWQAAPAKPYVLDEDLSAELMGQSPRIMRVNIGDDVSGRAYHVGLPNKMSYSFDPRTLSIEKAWFGRYLSLKNEKRGRADEASAPGVNAKVWPRSMLSSLFQPLLNDDTLVDFSFKEPAKINKDIVSSFLAHKTDFATEIAKIDANFAGVKTDIDAVPVFQYTVNDNEVSLQVEISPSGELDATFDFNNAQPQRLSIQNSDLATVSVGVGRIENGIWYVPAGKHNAVKFTAKFTKATDINGLDKTEDPKIADKAYTQTNAKQAMVWTQASPDKHVLPPGFILEDASPPLDMFSRPMLFEPLGIAFSDAGSAFVSTRTAGVWKVTNGHWQQFAQGVFGSLGLVVESESSVVIGEKPSLTRLFDKDLDGWSEAREILTDDFRFNSNYHEYLHGPVALKDGAYMFTLNLGHGLPGGYSSNGTMSTSGGYRGWAMVVDSNNQIKPYAYGLRSPAGLAKGPDGAVYYTDNQGDYFGTSKLHRVKEGAYYGHPASLVDLPNMTINSDAINWKQHIAKRDVAAVLLPHGLTMNSPGSPVWDLTNGQFGPYQGQMFIGDQSQSSIYRVATETINGVEQGALMPFMSNTASGAMRLTFSPTDSSMWIGQTGRGWWAKGGNMTALQRVVFDKQAIFQSVHSISITPKGFVVNFTQPVNTIEQESYKNLKMSSWYYLEDFNYGSAETGSRNEKIINYAWSSDGTRLELELADFVIDEKPAIATSRVYQFDLANTAFAEDVMHSFYNKAWYTVNAIPESE